MSERQRNIFSNLCYEEKEALQQLLDNDKITIKPADKGGADVAISLTILESALNNSTIHLTIGYLLLTLPIASIKISMKP